MTQYMKGPETTVLNSVFVHTQYLLTVFSIREDNGKPSVPASEINLSICTRNYIIVPARILNPRRPVSSDQSWRTPWLNQLSHKGGLLQGHPLPMPAKFSRHLFPHSSVILFTEWQTERSYDLCLVGGGNYIALRGSKPLPMCQPQPEVIRDSNSDLVNSLSSSVISLSVVKRGWWMYEKC